MFSADIHAKTNGELQTPIHYAAKFNAVRSLKILIDANADVNDRDYKRRTPLFVAAETGMCCNKCMQLFDVAILS